MENIEEIISYWGSNYKMISAYSTLEGKIYIGKPGKCRFCDKDKPDVTFRKDAHAIPESTGNNSLFSANECDSCNELFGGSIEDDFAKFLGGNRTLSQIHGKTGVPSYKTNAGHSRMDYGDNGITIINREDDSIIVIDEKKKQLEISMNRQPYTPLGVFKSLCKMAISICPDEILPYMKENAHWLLNKINGKYPYFSPFMISGFIPGPGPLNNAVFAILHKKTTTIDAPNLIFTLSFSNYFFQIAVPSKILDASLAGKNVTMTPFIHPYEISGSSGESVGKIPGKGS